MEERIPPQGRRRPGCKTLPGPLRRGFRVSRACGPRSKRRSRYVHASRETTSIPTHSGSGPSLSNDVRGSSVTGPSPHPSRALNTGERCGWTVKSLRFGKTTSFRPCSEKPEAESTCEPDPRRRTPAPLPGPCGGGGRPARRE